MYEPADLRSMTETLCINHITDSALRRHARRAMTERECSFCGRSGSPTETPFAVTMDSVAEEVHRAITSRYRSFDEASYFEGEPWESELGTGTVVQEVAQHAFDDSVSDSVLTAITAAIESPTSWFADDTQTQFAYSWEQFAETVRHEARFVFMARPRPGGENEPPARLTAFLDGLLGYADKSTRMLHTLEAGTKLYRGRMTDDAGALHDEVAGAPAEKLGSAPPHRAAAGRMSGEGVPLFYGADQLHTAVAEIALHSPYDQAVVGEFVTRRPLTILDFTRKPRLPSIFDHENRERRLFTEFVDDFVSAITKPVILDGRERVEYIPTQVVTEYLRWVPERRIDGIAFPSRADTTGKNIVLFMGQGEDILTDPPTPEERRELVLASKLGPVAGPSLTISPAAITEHAVTRSVRVTPIARLR